ncbi:hypothetical protein [Streptomyces sp. NPDC087856]|uniref:hypothetical protein n=1 Tax=Streptomyces sp. NPDC087856 TaxID=3365811 RepID=UPI003825FC00
MHIEVWIGDQWQRVTRLSGNKPYEPPADVSQGDDLANGFQMFLMNNPGDFWVQTTANPHAVYFGRWVPRLFRLVPVG